MSTEGNIALFHPRFLHKIDILNYQHTLQVQFSYVCQMETQQYKLILPAILHAACKTHKLPTIHMCLVRLQPFPGPELCTLGCYEDLT